MKRLKKTLQKTNLYCKYTSRIEHKSQIMWVKQAWKESICYLITAHVNVL